MTLEELEKLIADDEGGMVEVKETTGQRVEGCRTLCAFLNCNGGAVVFGVTKKGKITGQLVSDETKQNLARAFLDLEPGTEIDVEYVDVDATHKAIVCKVGRGARRPYVYDGRPYKRVESSTVKMPQEEYEALLADRRGSVSDWDFSPGRDLEMEDLDSEEVVRTARIAVAAGRLDPTADLSDVPSLLRKLHLMKGGRILNAAAVLFGKDFTYYPQCHLKLAWFRGTTKMEFLDTGSVYGNVFRLFDAAMTFLFRHLNMSATTSGKMERDEKLELPPDALREAVINALAHRSYTQPGGAVTIAVYDDRVEITNPGRFPPEINAATVMDGNEHESLPRNERIAGVLYMRKTIEAWGRGMRLIRESCAKADVQPPMFTCDGHFVKATFVRPSPTILKKPTILKTPTIQKKPTIQKASTTQKKPTTPKTPTTPKKPTTPKTPTTGKAPTTGKKTTTPKGRGKAFEGMTTEAVIDVIRAKDTVTISEMAYILGMSEIGVKYQLKLLTQRGRIRREGGRKSGRWVLSTSESAQK